MSDARVIASHRETTKQPNTDSRIQLMNPVALILVHVSTILISALCFYLFYLLLEKYRNNLMLPPLFLSLYVLTVGSCTCSFSC